MKKPFIESYKNLVIGMYVASIVFSALFFFFLPPIVKIIPGDPYRIQAHCFSLGFMCYTFVYYLINYKYLQIVNVIGKSFKRFAIGFLPIFIAVMAQFIVVFWSIFIIDGLFSLAILFIAIVPFAILTIKTCFDYKNAKKLKQTPYNQCWITKDLDK